ncbi:MAG: hypothetical protein R2851_02375 [Caldilineaceae bacterium]
MLLVATGRKPNVDDWIWRWPLSVSRPMSAATSCVNQHFTSNPLVYAIGDVTGQPAHPRGGKITGDCAPSSPATGVIAAIGAKLAYVSFTELQVGRAGLTAAQAMERGHQIREATIPLTHVARPG